MASAAYPPTAVVTNAVVAICVVLVPAAAVGATAEDVPARLKFPVNAGESSGAPVAVCHVAAVLLVAVRTWPTVGAVAADTATVVVALARPVAVVEAEAVCHVAAVLLVAVRTWPTVGAVAADTATVVVALASPVAVTACHEAATPLVAINTCPDVGAVAADTATVVVALRSPVAGPEDAVCHAAAVLLVAVKTWPVVGAVAADTATVVVADFKPLATPAVKPAAVPVAFVRTTADGVPRAGVTNVGDVAHTAEPVPVTGIQSITFVPSQRSSALVPLGTDTPVPADVFSVTAKPPVVAFSMMYSLGCVGHTTFRAAVRAPVIFNTAHRASSEAALLAVSV